MPVGGGRGFQEGLWGSCAPALDSPTVCFAPGRLGLQQVKAEGRFPEGLQQSPGASKAGTKLGLSHILRWELLRLC